MPPSDDIVLFRRAPDRLPRALLVQFAGLLRQQVAGGREFHCLITDDREMRRLNRKFLGRDYPTDVLSFPAGGGSEFLGEIAISSQRAVAQARALGHVPLDEFRLLMLHGLLHLLGMDHQTDGGRMARAEARWLKKLSLPAGLIRGARS